MKPEIFDCAMDFGYAIGYLLTVLETSDVPTPNQKFQMLRFAADRMQDTVMTIAEDAGMGLPARRSLVRDAAGRREEQPEPTEDAPEERGPADAPGRLDIKDIIDALNERAARRKEIGRSSPRREQPSEEPAGTAVSLDIKDIIDDIIAENGFERAVLVNLKRMSEEGR